MAGREDTRYGGLDQALPRGGRLVRKILVKGNSYDSSYAFYCASIALNKAIAQAFLGAIPEDIKGFTYKKPDSNGVLVETTLGDDLPANATVSGLREWLENTVENKHIDSLNRRRIEDLSRKYELFVHVAFYTKISSFFSADYERLKQLLDQYLRAIFPGRNGEIIYEMIQRLRKLGADNLDAEIRKILENNEGEGVFTNREYYKRKLEALQQVVSAQATAAEARIGSTTKWWQFSERNKRYRSERQFAKLKSLQSKLAERNHLEKKEDDSGAGAEGAAVAATPAGFFQRRKETKKLLKEFKRHTRDQRLLAMVKFLLSKPTHMEGVKALNGFLESFHEFIKNDSDLKDLNINSYRYERLFIRKFFSSDACQFIISDYAKDQNRFPRFLDYKDKMLWGLFSKDDEDFKAIEAIRRFLHRHLPEVFDSLAHDVNGVADPLKAKHILYEKLKEIEINDQSTIVSKRRQAKYNRLVAEFGRRNGFLEADNKGGAFDFREVSKINPLLNTLNYVEQNYFKQGFLVRAPFVLFNLFFNFVPYYRFPGHKGDQEAMYILAVLFAYNRESDVKALIDAVRDTRPEKGNEHLYYHKQKEAFVGKAYDIFARLSRESADDIPPALLKQLKKRVHRYAERHGFQKHIFNVDQYYSRSRKNRFYEIFHGADPLAGPSSMFENTSVSETDLSVLVHIKKKIELYAKTNAAIKHLLHHNFGPMSSDLTTLVWLRDGNGHQEIDAIESCKDYKAKRRQIVELLWTIYKDLEQSAPKRPDKDNAEYESNPAKYSVDFSEYRREFAKYFYRRKRFKNLIDGFYSKTSTREAEYGSFTYEEEDDRVHREAVKANFSNKIVSDISGIIAGNPELLKTAPPSPYVVMRDMDNVVTPEHRRRRRTLVGLRIFAFKVSAVVGLNEGIVAAVLAGLGVVNPIFWVILVSGLLTNFYLMRGNNEYTLRQLVFGLVYKDEHGIRIWDKGKSGKAKAGGITTGLGFSGGAGLCWLFLSIATALVVFHVLPAAIFTAAVTGIGLFGLLYVVSGDLVKKASLDNWFGVKNFFMEHFFFFLKDEWQYKSGQEKVAAVIMGVFSTLAFLVAFGLTVIFGIFNAGLMFEKASRTAEMLLRKANVVITANIDKITKIVSAVIAVGLGTLLFVVFAGKALFSLCIGVTKALFGPIVNNGMEVYNWLISKAQSKPGAEVNVGVKLLAGIGGVSAAIVSPVVAVALVGFILVVAPVYFTVGLIRGACMLARCGGLYLVDKTKGQAAWNAIKTEAEKLDEQVGESLWYKTHATLLISFKIFLFLCVIPNTYGQGEGGGSSVVAQDYFKGIIDFFGPVLGGLRQRIDGAAFLIGAIGFGAGSAGMNITSIDDAVEDPYNAGNQKDQQAESKPGFFKRILNGAVKLLREGWAGKGSQSQELQGEDRPTSSSGKKAEKGHTTGEVTAELGGPGVEHEMRENLGRGKCSFGSMARHPLSDFYGKQTMGERTSASKLEEDGAGYPAIP